MIEYKVGISNSSTTTYRKEGKQCFYKMMDQNREMRMIRINISETTSGFAGRSINIALSNERRNFHHYDLETQTARR